MALLTNFIDTRLRPLPTYLTSSSTKRTIRDDGYELLCEAILEQAVWDWKTYFMGNDLLRVVDSATHEPITRKDLITFFNSEEIEIYLIPFPSLSAHLLRAKLGVPTIEAGQVWMK